MITERDKVLEVTAPAQIQRQDPLCDARPGPGTRCAGHPALRIMLINVQFISDVILGPLSWSPTRFRHHHQAPRSRQCADAGQARRGGPS